MYAKLALCSLLFHILIHKGAYGQGIMESNRKIPNEPLRVEQVNSDNPSSQLNPIDPSTIIFFVPKDLKIGNTIPIYFPRKPFNSSQLLPEEQTESNLFTSQTLLNLKFAWFAPGSPQALAMEETVRHCDVKPKTSESNFCAKSIESMIDFSQIIFGLGNKIEVLKTVHFTKSNTAILQNYKVMGFKEIQARKGVACHSMTPFGYTVLYCHIGFEGKRSVFKVSLLGGNGDKVEATAVCHVDTPPNHISFKVLGIEPGSSHICHFFPADNFVLVPSSTNMKVYR